MHKKWIMPYSLTALCATMHTANNCSDQFYPHRTTFVITDPGICSNIEPKQRACFMHEQHLDPLTAKRLPGANSPFSSPEKPVTKVQVNEKTSVAKRLSFGDEECLQGDSSVSRAMIQIKKSMQQQEIASEPVQIEALKNLSKRKFIEEKEPLEPVIHTSPWQDTQSLLELHKIAQQTISIANSKRAKVPAGLKSINNQLIQCINNPYAGINSIDEHTNPNALKTHLLNIQSKLQKS